MAGTLAPSLPQATAALARRIASHHGAESPTGGSGTPYTQSMETCIFMQERLVKEWESYIQFPFMSQRPKPVSSLLHNNFHCQA